MSQLPSDVLDALRRGEPIEAMKLLRKETGLSLKDARQAIDRGRGGVVATHAPKATRGTAPMSTREHTRAPRPDELSPGEVPRRGGFGLVALVLFVVLAAWWILRRG